MKYKSSKYNYFFKFKKKYYIFNGLSGSIIETDNILQEKIKNQIFKTISDDIINNLIEENIIVSSEMDETKAYLYYYENTRYHESANSYSFTIIPTYSCNLSCTYCSQGKQKKNNIISLKQTQNIIEFIKNSIKNSSVSIKKINLQLFGGEPLLAKKICMKLIEEIEEICNEKFIEFNNSITTNATLLDEKIITFFKKYKTNIQISIDGLPNDHDKRRIYKNRLGTFNTILKNINLLSAKDMCNNLSLRINLDKETMNSAKHIFDLFKKKSNDIYFAFLQHIPNINDNYKNKCISDSCTTENMFILSKILLENGLTPPSQFGKKMPCALNGANNFFIDCFLDLYKCDLLIGNSQMKVGHIDNVGNLIISSQFFSQMNRSPVSIKKCYTCKLLPNCAGGCAAQAYFHKGNLNAPYCEISEKKLLEQVKNYINLNLI